MPHLILQDVPSSVEPYDVIACHTDDALTAKLRKTWDAQRVAQVGRYTFIELADPGVAEAANAAMYNSSTCTITAAVVKDQALWDECWGVLRTHRAGDASDEPVSTAATRLVAAAAPCTSAPMSGTCSCAPPLYQSWRMGCRTALARSLCCTLALSGPRSHRLWARRIWQPWTWPTWQRATWLIWRCIHGKSQAQQVKLVLCRSLPDTLSCLKRMQHCVRTPRQAHTVQLHTSLCMLSHKPASRTALHSSACTSRK